MDVQSCTSHDRTLPLKSRKMAGFKLKPLVCLESWQVSAPKLIPGASGRAGRNIAPSHQISLVTQSIPNQQNMQSYIMLSKLIDCIKKATGHAGTSQKKKSVRAENDWWGNACAALSKVTTQHTRESCKINMCRTCYKIIEKWDVLKWEV